MFLLYFLALINEIEIISETVGSSFASQLEIIVKQTDVFVSRTVKNEIW